MAPASSQDRIDEMRLSALERTSEHFAQTVTAFTSKFSDIDRDIAVRAEKDINSEARMSRIEKSIAGIYGAAKWTLVTFLACLIALIVNFLFKGGPLLP